VGSAGVGGRYRHPSEFVEAKLASMALISLKQCRYTFTVAE
jgi:hypothetical protein